MSDKINMTCPKCGGTQMWDNRLSKKNPKAPDMKCVDKSCDGVIWPPKDGAKPAAAPKPDNTPRAYSAGPHIPEMDGPLAPADVESGSVFPKLQTMLSVYDVLFDHAHGLARKAYGDNEQPAATAAMAATLLITAKDAGLFR